MKNYFIPVFLSLLLYPAALFAWTNHTVMTYASLKEYPGLENKIVAESIESFLLKEESRIAAALDAEEAWAREHITAYAPRPDALRFSSNKERNIRVRFLNALRLNPEMTFELFLQPADINDKRPPAEWKKVSKYPVNYLKRPIVSIKPGEKVSPLEVTASASNEPDDGYDMGLFADNNTAYGKLYGYGNQDISDPKEFTYSQAPFHMGFYHESRFAYIVAPFLKRSYPEQRTHMYHTLSRLAFETGHPYWGYRFAGMGMHYIADINFPYHSGSFPGISTAWMFITNILYSAGITGPYDKAMALIVNAHFFNETIIYNKLRKFFDSNDYSSPLMTALSDSSGDQAIPAYSGKFIADVVSLDAAERSEDFADSTEDIITDTALFNRTAELSNDPAFNPESASAGAPSEKMDAYWKAVEGMLRAHGGFLRIYLKSAQTL